MILDITAIKNYKDIKNLQKLSISLDMDKVILVLDDSPNSLSPDYLSKSFRKIIDKSITLDKRLHLHNLRASCVSILAHRGISLSDIAMWIGDSVETTTKYYLRTCAHNQLQTGQAMANVLF